MRTILTLVIVCIGFACYGQQLVYKPTNPMFGGDTFNSQQLLASANAQNSFTDPNAVDRDGSELEQFSESQTDSCWVSLVGFCLGINLEMAACSQVLLL